MECRMVQGGCASSHFRYTFQAVLVSSWDVMHNCNVQFIKAPNRNRNQVTLGVVMPYPLPKEMQHL